MNAQAPVINAIARVFRIRTEETPWRVGYKGEEMVGRQLAKLGFSWHYLNSVPVGTKNADIDHVVIGPTGVFTLNTKRRDRGKAWVGERALFVNGHATEYLRNSRFEARRSQRLLGKACDFDVPVTPVTVFVDLASFTVKQMPSDVYVTTSRKLLRCLRSMPVSLDANTVEAIYAKARLSSTWQLQGS